MSSNDKKAIFTFGRFQPPTIGHAVLINGLEQLGIEKDADVYVFISSSCNDLLKYTSGRKFKEIIRTDTFESCAANENPLTVEQKIKWLHIMYPETNINFINTTETDTRTPFKAADYLKNAGYTSVNMRVGSDRVNNFKRLFQDDIIVEAIGNVRNATSSNIKGVSGTKMRKAAVAGDKNTFRAGVMIGKMTDALADELMGEIRAGLGYVGGNRKKVLRNKTKKVKHPR